MAFRLNAGVLYDLMGDNTKSMEEYNLMLDLGREEEDTTSLYRGLVNLGNLHVKLSALDEAERYLKQAELYAENESSRLSFIANNKGDIYLEKGDWEKAMSEYHRSILLFLNHKEIDVNQSPKLEACLLSPDKIRLIDLLIDKGNAWLKFYHQKNASDFLNFSIQTFELADQLIDDINANHREELSKLFWRSRGADLYATAVEACYLKGDSEKAFYFMEKNSAMILLENVNGKEAMHSSGIALTDLKSEFALRESMASLEYDVLASNENKLSSDSVINALFEMKERYRRFMDSLEIKYPVYKESKRDLEIIPANEVITTMDEDQMVLNYLLGDEKGYVSKITTDEIELFEIINAKELKEDLLHYHKMSSSAFSSIDDQLAFAALSSSLFNRLFPFDKIKEQLEGKRIKIIGDYNFQSIPFETFIIPSDSLNLPDDYLISQCEISYDYSLSLAAKRRAHEKEVSGELVSFSPIIFGYDNLPALKEDEKQINLFKDLFDGKYYVQDQAKKQDFFNQFGGNKIVHISTHAGVDENSRPWLAMFDDKIGLTEMNFRSNPTDLVEQG